MMYIISVGRQFVVCVQVGRIQQGIGVLHVVVLAGTRFTLCSWDYLYFVPAATCVQC